MNDLIAERPDRQALIDLYRIAIEEYRFEVRLGWDRTREFLVLNIAVMSVATGLLKLEGAPEANYFVMVIFLIGLMISILGISVVRRAHQYYRMTVYKKTLIENILGLHLPIEGHSYAHATLAIGTTSGMRSTSEMLSDPQAWLQRPVAKRHIVFMVSALLCALAILNIVGAMFAWLQTQ